MLTLHKLCSSCKIIINVKVFYTVNFELVSIKQIAKYLLMYVGNAITFNAVISTVDREVINIAEHVTSRYSMY